MRIYVQGTEEKCKEFTIDLVWYHSAAARIGSTISNSDGTITLDLIVSEGRHEDVIRFSKKFDLKVIWWE